jgi:hypothetical protein
MQPPHGAESQTNVSQFRRSRRATAAHPSEREGRDCYFDTLDLKEAKALLDE